MAKPKPKGWNSMSKAKQEAWKKANFDSSTKVTQAQLNKLRAEKTPEKAIAKYKNDPAMREALNRFYGKARVGSVTATPSTPSGPKGKGPGYTRPKPPQGKGPGYTRPKGPNATTKTPKAPSVGKQVGAAAAGVGVAALAARGMTKMDKKDVANAKTAAGKHRKTASGPKHKMTDRPSNSGKAAMKTAAKHKATRMGVTNKMKAQGTKIMSSAGSRYNQARRGK